MPLSLKQINDTVLYMDEVYDANFGNWIRNEDNCKIVGLSLRKYIEEYRESEFITVLKWIVKDWTLRSIIILAKRLVMDELGAQGPEGHARRVRVVAGLVYTWSPVFVAEFLLASTAELAAGGRTELMAGVLGVFDTRKVGEILAQVEEKVDGETRKELARKFKKQIYQASKDEKLRRGSMVEAYRIM